MAKDRSVKKQSVEKTNRFQIKDPPPDYGKSKPIFSFFHMRYGKTYCLSKCEHGERSNLATLLLQMSQKTWDEIASTYRKSLGFEHIPVKKFHATVFPDIVTPDVVSLLVFAYSHGGRVAGIQQDDIFHILLVGENLYKH